MTTKVLVSDTNTWIDLDRGRLLKEVFSLPYQFVTTDFVWEELHQPSGASIVDLGLQVEELLAEEVMELFDLKIALNNSSLADVSCYYLASSRGWVLLTNDGAVRKAAQANELEVRGVLWLMDQLHDLSAVPGKRLVDSLQRMLDSGARLPQAECEKRMKRWSVSDQV